AAASAAAIACRGHFRHSPTVVLITIDSLRTDSVGCYGADADVTPTIDALADEGVVYTAAHSTSSWTLASHASLFTGLYPSAHQVVKDNLSLGSDYTTLAGLMSARGYQTAAVVGGPFLLKMYGLDNGFERYDDSPTAIDTEKGASDSSNAKVSAALE